ncbi:MAG: glycosyltransferase family 2 protein, partial [Calditrichaeota bacterium]
AHEQQILNLWHDHFPVEVKKETIDKGLFIITPQAGASNIRKKNVISKHAPKTNGQLGITLLTGCRPNLLQQTLHALEAHMLPLLHSSYVVVLLNSDDTNSKAIIDKLTYVDKCIMPSKSLLSIGKATSLLMQEISSNKIVRYVLHLEDDWLLQSNKTQTIENACTLLAEQKNIGQVRLRLSAEKVLPYHMVTRKPIVWEPQGEFLHTTSAHFTFNPHLIRCSDIAHIYPCETEKEAQQHFLELRSATAQHTPGLFKHNGENGQSLRMRENGRQSQVLLQSTMVDQIKEYGNSRPITTFSKPKVSCLMPTANRRDFVPLAIRNFQAQTYKNLELIILDDGRDSVADLIPDDPCIHYHRVQGKMQIGKKRNRICELANGEIFIHWDDDDWHRRDRIKLQVDALLYSGKALCGIATMYFWDQQARKAWQYVYPAGRRHWVAGGSLCYWRKTWEHTPFPEIRFGEDTRFVWNRNACDIHVMQDNTFYVGRIHDHNTCKKMTNSRYWHPVDLKRIQEIMDSDFKEKIENTAKC